MKKILLVGTVACGKTTLCQRLNGLTQSYKKTQAIEVIGKTVDTPGEYMERRSLVRNLMLMAADVDLVLFLVDPTQEQYLNTPGLATGFPVPVIGVVSKTDLASERQILDALEVLEIIGAAPVFQISSVSGDGMQALLDYLHE